MLRDQKTSFWKFLVALGLLASLSLVLGGWWVTRNTSAQVQKSEALRREEVTAQVQLLTNSFRATLESLGVQAQQMGANPQAMIPAASGILYFAEAELAGGRIQTIKKLLRSPQLSEDKLFEDRFAQAVVEMVSPAEIKEFGESVSLLPQEPGSHRQWLLVAFSSGSAMNRVNAILIDPAESFSVLKNWAVTSSNPSIRAYLISSDGSILAHSQPSYAGSVFIAAHVFSDGIRNVFGGTRTSDVGRFDGIDNVPVTAAFERLDSFPLAWVVERVREEPVLSLFQDVKPVVIASLIIIGVLGIALLFGAWALSRMNTVGEDEFKEPELLPFQEALGAATAAGPQKPAELLPQLSPMLSPMLSEDTLKIEEVPPEKSLPQGHFDDQLFADFHEASSRQSQPRAVADRMTHLANQMFSKPVLFFMYHPELRTPQNPKGTAVLQSVAGFPSEKRPQAMSIPVTERAITHITECATEGVIASFSNYPPLLQAISQRIGSEQFEAWAVTGQTPLVRSGESLKPRILGILVILESEAEKSQESVARIAQMVRASALAYEKALLSH